ncbi:hypothetical protein AB0M95_39420 [Sphaerisporangium sp. NPDC051017]|uniref:hypothetical protein n=1 Tax=Sphaerisporangium sp. NPDC051017 TaxID=3154636 RepID=UPI00341F83BB
MADTTQSAPPKMLAKVNGEIHSLDVDPAGRWIALVHGGSENYQSNVFAPTGASVSIISIADGKTSDVNVAGDPSAVAWAPDGSSLAVQNPTKWLLVDRQSAETTAEVVRPDKGDRPCFLAGMTVRGILGWCSAVGEMVTVRENGRPQVLVKPKGVRQFAGTVSVAVDNVKP